MKVFIKEFVIIISEFCNFAQNVKRTVNYLLATVMRISELHAHILRVTIQTAFTTISLESFKLV